MHALLLLILQHDLSHHASELIAHAHFLLLRRLLLLETPFQLRPCFLIQWNPSIAATQGEQHFGRYIGVAFIEVLFCTQTVHSFGTWVPGHYAEVPLFRRGR